MKPALWPALCAAVSFVFLLIGHGFWVYVFAAMLLMSLFSAVITAVDLSRHKRPSNLDSVIQKMKIKP